MAAPGIVGVQPVPNQPGAYNAQLGNGQNMLVTGTAGQSLFDRFKQFAPTVATTALGAIPGAGAIKSIGDVAGALKGNDDMGSPPGPNAAPPAAPGPTVPAAVEPGPAPSSSQGAPGQAAPQPQGDVPLGYTMEAVGPGGQKVVGPAVRRPDGSIGVYVPPSRGSPSGLTKLGKGAIAASGEMEDQIANSRAAEVAARDEGVMLAKEDAARQQAFHEEQKIQNMLAVQDQQDENEAIAARVAQRQERYDQLSADARAGRIDENQYMRDSQGVFSALGMALGALGSALARTPNFAADFVQSQIDRNIRRQEAELATKGKAADNALGDLLREQGSLKDAKATLKQLLTERSAIEANVMASTAKDAAIAARGREIAAQLAGQWAVQDKARRQGDLEHVMTSRLYYQPGTAGSTGGFLQPTLQGVQNVKDLQSPGAAGGQGSATPAAAVESISGMAQAIVAADKIKANLGSDTSEHDDPLSGPFDRVKRVVSSDASRKASELDQATVALAKGVQSAFGKSDRDAEDALQMASGGGSAAERSRAADSLRVRAVQQARQTLAGLPPAQQQAMLSAMPPEARAAILDEK